jgi:hypothetical protein
VKLCCFIHHTFLIHHGRNWKEDGRMNSDRIPKECYKISNQRKVRKISERLERFWALDDQ